MEISCTDREEVLHRVKEERNILQTVKGRKGKCIGCILRSNCIIKNVTEGKGGGRMEVKERLGRKCKQLLDDLKETKVYCKLKEKALDRTLWRMHFGRGYAPLVREKNVLMNRTYKAQISSSGTKCALFCDA
jgi:hypothetical protein